MGVGKRHFKRAVDRNRIKRLVREAYRVRKELLRPLLREEPLQVFFIYTGRAVPPFAEVEAAVEGGLQKLLRTLAAP